jgi:hypothetical protein
MVIKLKTLKFFIIRFTNYSLNINKTNSILNVIKLINSLNI